MSLIRIIGNFMVGLSIFFGVILMTTPARLIDYAYGQGICTPMGYVHYTVPVEIPLSAISAGSPAHANAGVNLAISQALQFSVGDAFFNQEVHVTSEVRVTKNGAVVRTLTNPAQGTKGACASWGAIGTTLTIWDYGVLWIYSLLPTAVPGPGTQDTVEQSTNNTFWTGGGQFNTILVAREGTVCIQETGVCHTTVIWVLEIL